MPDDEQHSNVYLVLLVLFGVALLLFLLFIASTGEAGQKEIEEDKCRASINLHATLLRSSGGEAEPAIECEPRHVAIDGRDEAHLKEALAGELAFCWERWQQGRVELFEEEGTYCNPCSLIRFTGEDRRVSGFDEVLDREWKEGLSYRDYLFPEVTGQYPEEGRDPELVPGIDTSRRYATVFYYDKSHSAMKIRQALEEDPGRGLSAALAESKGAAAGSVLGTAVGGVGGAVVGLVITIKTAGAGFLAIPGGAVKGGAAGGALGSLIGGMAGGGWNLLMGEVEVPEWYAVVALIPHNGTAYRELGCQRVGQGGRQETDQRTGAENI